MFGLGWLELLIIGGAVSLLAGPAMLRKLMQTARDVQKVKSDLTDPRAIERLLSAEADEDEDAHDDDEPT